MVQKVAIENFKSIQYLELELGRVNVLIGENGSGKSNILEAIAMGSAAAEDKLENQFLSSRGIRTTDPKAMRAGFEKENVEKSIRLNFSTEKQSDLIFELKNDNTPFSEWAKTEKIGEFLSSLFKKETHIKDITKFALSFVILRELYKKDAQKTQLINQVVNDLLALQKPGEEMGFDESMLQKLTKDVVQEDFKSLQNFLIFAPENYFLRRFEEESQIEPLDLFPK